MTPHRLNHHDIVALDVVRTRRRARANAIRRADRIVIASSILCFAALMVLHAIGWLQ